MAKINVVCLMLLALIAISMVATEVDAYKRSKYKEGSLKPYQCLPQCKRRCSRTQHYNNCMLFCQYCCKKCLCVPPGYYGNKEVCPCYNNWKTQQGGPKCP